MDGHRRRVAQRITARPVTGGHRQLVLRGRLIIQMLTRRQADHPGRRINHKQSRPIAAADFIANGLAVPVGIIQREAVIDVHQRRTRREILSHRYRVIDNLRRIVDRHHTDGDGTGGGAAFAVADGDREAVVAVEIGSWRVGKGAVGIQGHTAVDRCTVQAVAQAVTIQVAGDDGAGNRLIFDRRQLDITGGRNCIGRIGRPGR